MRWSERVEETLGIEAWTSKETELVLDLARDVAHGTERRFAPLTTYALGVAVGMAAAEGADRAGTAADLVAQLQQAVEDARAEAGE